ncbi:MAG: hypothetical protein Q7K03_09280 [Dehalococcoidia bacterium]|nr:hypothetical protein [Dehalococcoidia bacterium]
MATQQPANNPFEYGPFVQVAAFCDRVLREADGVLSLIRVVDVINHTATGPNAPIDMPPVNYPLTLVLSLKSGKAKGRHEVTITPEMPSGETMPVASVSVRLEGEGKGYNIITQLNMQFKLEGLYWFIIRFDGELLTRLPLELRYARLVTGPGQPPR